MAHIIKFYYPRLIGDTGAEVFKSLQQAGS